MIAEPTEFHWQQIESYSISIQEIDDPNSEVEVKLD